MIIKVELLAFENEKGNFRNVETPTIDEVCYFGQNDFQPQPCRSICMGDVIHIDNKKIMIQAIGFKEITNEEYENYCNTPRRDRAFLPLVDNNE